MKGFSATCLISLANLTPILAPGVQGRPCSHEPKNFR